MANERTGNYPAAVKAYERGLEVEPKNVELLNSLGFALFQQGKSEESVAALEKALAVDPKHWKAHNNMALASIDIGELEMAEIHYRESLAIQPQPAIYNDLGFVLERQGMPDEAVEMYRKSLDLDPASASAHYNMAASLARSGEFAKAEPHFRAVIEKKPSTQAYTGLGIVLWQQGRGDEAIVSLQNAIKADPKNASAYDQLGTIQVQQGKLEEAASTYRSLVRNQPSAAAHQELAQVLKRLGRTDEARKELERRERAAQ
jgi:tetratricopeptide (TPR) repeat protein